MNQLKKKQASVRGENTEGISITASERKMLNINQETEINDDKMILLGTNWDEVGVE